MQPCDGECPFGPAADRADRSNDRARIAQITAVGGGAMLVTGAVLWYLGRGKPGRPARRSHPARCSFVGGGRLEVLAMRAPSIMKALTLLVLASCTHDLDVYDRVTVQALRATSTSCSSSTTRPIAARYDQDGVAARHPPGRSLAQRRRPAPNLHVGTVTTTDLGTRGTKDVLGPPSSAQLRRRRRRRQAASTSSGAGISARLPRGPAGPRRHAPAQLPRLGRSLARAESRLTNPAAGTANTGCEFEQPLEAMRRALDPFVNPGFIRQGAMLAVVFLATEDDWLVRARRAARSQRRLRSASWPRSGAPRRA